MVAPIRTCNHVVPVAQGYHPASSGCTTTAHVVAGVGSDQAVGGVDDSSDAFGSVSQSRRSPIAIPVGSIISRGDALVKDEECKMQNVKCKMINQNWVLRIKPIHSVGILRSCWNLAR